MTVLVTWFNGFAIFLDGQWNVANFVVAYITLPIFAFMYVGWKLYKKTSFVRLADMDFETGRRELDEMCADEEAKFVEPTTWYAKLWALIF